MLNLLKGIIHALINYFVTIYVVYKELDKYGHESNLWVISSALYTNILILISINMVIFTKYHTFILVYLHYLNMKLFHILFEHYYYL